MKNECNEKHVLVLSNSHHNNVHEAIQGMLKSTKQEIGKKRQKYTGTK